jgi:hypothetical protein
MKFFIDYNLSPQLAAGLKGFGEDVMHIIDRFDAGAEDIEWLSYVGSEGMILVTRDDKIRRHPLEKRALKEHRIGAFFLGGKNQNRCALIQQVVRSWPRMKDLATKTDRPFAFRVRPGGRKIESIPL